MFFFYSIFVQSANSSKATEAIFINTLKTLFDIRNIYDRHRDREKSAWESIKCSLHHILALVAVFATVDFALGPRISGRTSVRCHASQFNHRPKRVRRPTMMMREGKVTRNTTISQLYQTTK